MKYDVFVSSSDAYSDLWPLFFELFKKYWPEFEGAIYLNTEEMSFECDGLDIRPTKVGRLGSFGKVFRAGLDCVESETILLVMIDYFFMGKVNEHLLGEYFEYFSSADLDSLCLIPNPQTHTESAGVLDLDVAIPPSHNLFSYQIAFWKKSVLREMALPHETPWLSEWYGTARANQMSLRLAVPRENSPIPYLPEGALHKGKWVEPMVEFLRNNQFNVDFSRRGYFVEREATLLERVHGRYKTFWPRILSQFDLTKRYLLK